MVQRGFFVRLYCLRRQHRRSGLKWGNKQRGDYMDTFAALASGRFSVRQFTAAPVAPEKVEALKEMIRIAPTAANMQPHRVKVITSPEDLAKIDECSPCRYEAPLVLLVCYDRTGDWVRPFDDARSGLIDASVVATHLMLLATDLGLGTTWVMWFDPEVLRELFALPPEFEPVAILPIGYPVPDADISGMHYESKPLEDLLF